MDDMHIPQIDGFESLHCKLNRADLDQIFIFMLRKYLGCEKFAELISEASTEMEVYDLVEDGSKLKALAAALVEKESQGKKKKPAMMAAIKMAVQEGDPNAKEYLEIEAREHEILDQIYEKYGDCAMKKINDLLAINARKALTMNGPVGRKLQAAISGMSR